MFHLCFIIYLFISKKERRSKLLMLQNSHSITHLLYNNRAVTIKGNLSYQKALTFLKALAFIKS